MQVTRNAGSVTVSTYYYKIELNEGSFRLSDPRMGHVLLDCPSALVVRPQLDAAQRHWSHVRWDVQSSGSGKVEITLHHASEDGGPDVVLTLLCFDKHIEMHAVTGPLKAACRVASWDLFAPGASLNLFHLHHWRNVHGHTGTYETHNLYQGSRYGQDIDPALNPEIARQWTAATDVTTFSTDWQFAPRPSLLLLQRDSVMLGLATCGLSHGFGLQLLAAANQLHYCRIDYGGAENGQTVAVGECAASPRFYLWLDYSGSVWDSVDHYVGLLREDGMIGPPRSYRDAPHWWTRPMYCTWNDQGYLASSGVTYNWMGDAAPSTSPTTAFNEPMLDALLDTLERERLNIGAVIIDDGWQTNRGQWEPAPQRFPRLREQIERIHDLGMKAVLWIAPLDFWEGADVLSHPEWLCGRGVLGRFGMPLVDYSDPRTQEGIVLPMLDRFFGDGPGCLNADGLKLDFMAEKVQPVFPVHDPEWRGEERFILRMIELLNARMKSIKPDAVMLGCVAHPFFTNCQDLIRTYDVPVSQHQHADRAEMLRHFNPGNYVSLDLSESRSLSDIEQHIEMALRDNMLYELARVAPDPASGQFALGPDYYPLLHRKLQSWPQSEVPCEQ